MLNRKFFAPIAVVMLPGAAMALSCLPPDIRDSFHSADASEKSYIVVEGEFTLEDPEFAAEPGKLKLTSGSFKGRWLGSRSKSSQFEHPVTFEVGCVEDICEKILPGENLITFLRKEKGEYFVEVRPCGGSLFYGPRKSDKEAVQQCLNGGDC